MKRTLPLALLALALAGPASAEPVSPWARDEGVALRLVDAGPGPEPGGRLAAIAIRLEPGWKTYWRQPGASGVPPRFDFSGSDNVASAKVSFPPPERSEDESGVTNVYHGEVSLPVAVTPRDPSRPAELRLVATIGVCDQICVPVRAETALRLDLAGGGAGPAADEARRALAAAPKPVRLGQPGPLAILSVRLEAAAGKASALVVEAAAPSGAEPPALFAETGEGDFAPAPEPDGPATDGRARFRIAFDEPHPPASGLRLTLVSGGEAVEASVPLDAIRGAD